MIASDFSQFSDIESDLSSDEEGEENIDLNKILNFKIQNIKNGINEGKDFDEKLKFYHMFDVKAPGIKNPDYVDGQIEKPNKQ